MSGFGHRLRVTPQDFADQVVVVTGAASGIGQAIACAFARNGAQVVLADKDSDGAVRVVKDIQAAGGLAHARSVNVTNEHEVEELAAWVTRECGAPAIVVNNAGICEMKPFLELRAPDFRRMWEVHFLGTFLVSRSFLAPMLQNRFGRIINVTSGLGGFAGSPVTTHYQAAKSAQTSLTLGMAAALAREGITVNCVSPGLVLTPLWQGLGQDVLRATGHTLEEEVDARLSNPSSLGRPIKPDEVARVVLFLAHPDSGALTGRIVDV